MSSPARALLSDDQAAIRLQLERWIADPEIDVVISTGGTGLTGRDVTVEAFKSVFEKEIDGFSVHLPPDQLRENRHLDAAVARLRGRRARHLSLRPARLDGRSERRLGRHPQMATRHPPPPLQFRRDHAAAGRTPAEVDRVIASCFLRLRHGRRRHRALAHQHQKTRAVLRAVPMNLIGEIAHIASGRHGIRLGRIPRCCSHSPTTCPRSHRRSGPSCGNADGCSGLAAIRSARHRCRASRDRRTTPPAAYRCPLSTRCPCRRRSGHASDRAAECPLQPARCSATGRSRCPRRAKA